MGWIVLQLVTILFVSPLVQGVIQKTKAYLQGRSGPSVWQPYYHLLKYMKKEAIISEHASKLTLATPYIVWVTLLTAGLLIPTFFVGIPLGFMGDILVIIYLFGLARLLMALTALDAGGSFGGMGSSREMVLAALVEPALFLSVLTVTFGSGSWKLDQVIASLLEQNGNGIGPAYFLAMAAMLIVVIAETGRIPVDNPDTHLELTMMHEGMLLEYSGRYLGLMMWAAQIKQLLVLSLFVNLFFPDGMAWVGDGWSVWLSFGLYLLKMLGMGLVMAVIETLCAKIRLFVVPKFLASSMGLSVLALISQVMK